VRISLSQLRRIIKEASDIAQGNDGVGSSAIRSFLLGDLLKDNGLSIEDVIEQAEGAGFESENVEDTIEEMVGTGELIDEDGILAVA
jgi:hypothetical protein